MLISVFFKNVCLKKMIANLKSGHKVSNKFSFEGFCINKMLLHFFFFRENIKQIVKLLASVRALDHAMSVASDHNVKEFKSLIEGK